jgi:hypothetical protein
MDNSAGIGGSYADIAIAEPNDICSYSYNVCGGSETKEDTINNMVPTTGHEEQIRRDIIRANKNMHEFDEYGYTKSEYAGASAYKDDPYAARTKASLISFFNEVNNF